MYWRLAGVVIGVLLGCAAPAVAQVAGADEAYGSGVHAFYAGEYQQAFDALSGVIKNGTKDPRFYYYRGLALLKLGRGEDAAADFTAGAKLETADLDGMYNVSRAMERIQGAERRTLEKHRAEARRLAYEKAIQVNKERYENLKREESRVLEKQASGAGAGAGAAPKASFGEEGPIPAKPSATPADKPAAKAADPFESETPKTVPPPPPAKIGAGAATEATDDPFAPNPLKSDKPAAAAKIGAAKATTTKPTTKPKASKTADAADGDDPFGSSAPATKPAAKAKTKPAAKAKAADAGDGDDPFGSSAPATKPAKTKPAAKAKAADAGDGDDPFGSSAPAAKPAKTKPAAKAKAADAGDGDDPFGSSAPATKPAAKAAGKAAAKAADAGDDPFATDAAPAKPAAKAKAAAKDAAKAAATDDPFADTAPKK